MTSCFVYKVMGLTFHDRINTQLMFKNRDSSNGSEEDYYTTKTFSRFESHWLLFFIHFLLLLFFWRRGGWGRSDFIILFLSYFFFFLFFFCIIFFIFYPFNMYKVYIKNFCNNTNYCKFGNSRECERYKIYLRRQNL